MTLRNFEILSWIILCRMKDACRGKINICSACYVTQKKKIQIHMLTGLSSSVVIVSFPSLASSPCKIKSIFLYANQLDLYISSADDPLFFFSTLLCSQWKYDLKHFILFRIDLEFSEYFSSSSWRALPLSSRCL